MYFLKETSKVIERFRIVWPQYWMDELMADIHKANDGAGVATTGQVLAILRHPETEREVAIPGLGVIRKLGYLAGLPGLGLPKKVRLGVNLVTNDGDLYYAQSAMGETPTDDYTTAGAGLRLGSAATTPVKGATDLGTFLSGTGHDIDATYPKTNDGDADNTGSGTDIATWTYSYTTGEGNVSGIAEGAITDDHTGTPPTAALTHFLFAASFNKTSSDTLKVIVNHEFLGV